MSDIHVSFDLETLHTRDDAIFQLHVIEACMEVIHEHRPAAV